MIKKTINGIKYWGQLFLLPIYWLSFLFPRSKNIWVFGSTFGRRFADNPRYAYLYCCQHAEDLHVNKKNIFPIWISHNKDVVQLLQENNLKAYYYRSLTGIWYCLRAKVYIYDNYSKDISFSGKYNHSNFYSTFIEKNLAKGIIKKCRNLQNIYENEKIKNQS